MSMKSNVVGGLEEHRPSQLEGDEGETPQIVSPMLSMTKGEMVT